MANQPAGPAMMTTQSAQLRSSGSKPLSTMQTIQNLIYEVTGIEPEEATENTYLEEYNLELPKIVAKINDHFKIHLQARSVLNECETIGDLADLVEDEATYESDSDEF